MTAVIKNNLELWNKVEKTDPKFTKTIQQGRRKITSINAQYQIKNATKEFGKYGDTWGLKDISISYIQELTKEQMLAVVSGVFYYPDGVFEIGSSIYVQRMTKNGLSVDEDFVKKVETDIITKSLSKLGFNADIFFGKYEDSKYLNELQQKFNPKIISTKEYNTAKSKIKDGQKDEKFDKVAVLQWLDRFKDDEKVKELRELAE